MPIGVLKSSKIESVNKIGLNRGQE